MSSKVAIWRGVQVVECVQKHKQSAPLQGKVKLAFRMQQGKAIPNAPPEYVNTRQRQTAHM